MPNRSASSRDVFAHLDLYAARAVTADICWNRSMVSRPRDGAGPPCLWRCAKVSTPAHNSRQQREAGQLVSALWAVAARGGESAAAEQAPLNCGACVDGRRMSAVTSSNSHTV